jgi:hypothetical protein
MGQRISYFKNDHGKGLKDLLIENFSAFKIWYLDYDKDSIEEFNEPFADETFKAHLVAVNDLALDFKNLEKKFIDELTSEFIGIYYDYTHQGNDMLTFFGPTMSIWRYQESDDMVLSTKDPDFINLWNFLIKGRSLKDNQAFGSYTNEYKIGFLSQDENKQLKSKIEHYFGDIEDLHKKYWTDTEKMKFQQAIDNSKDGTWSMSNHNPKSSGLEYVLDAINSLTTHHKELITGID